jgi:glycosyltransferase involved in cell wall biosynthesis
MKIVYIITRADEYGGAQVHVRDLSKWMTQHGHEVHVIGGQRGIVSEVIESNGIRFHEAPSLIRHIHPIKDLTSFFEVRKILKNITPDIISCHSSKAGLIGRFAARTIKKKAIFTAHGWAFTEGVSWKKKYIFRVLEWFMAFIGNHIITVSRFDKIIALQYGVTRAKNMTVVHNGMPYRPPPPNAHSNDIPQLCKITQHCLTPLQ